MPYILAVMQSWLNIITSPAMLQGLLHSYIQSLTSATQLSRGE